MMELPENNIVHIEYENGEELKTDLKDLIVGEHRGVKVNLSGSKLDLSIGKDMMPTPPNKNNRIYNAKEDPIVMIRIGHLTHPIANKKVILKCNDNLKLEHLAVGKGINRIIANKTSLKEVDASQSGINRIDIEYNEAKNPIIRVPDSIDYIYGDDHLYVDDLSKIDNPNEIELKAHDDRYSNIVTVNVNVGTSIQADDLRSSIDRMKQLITPNNNDQ